VLGANDAPINGQCGYTSLCHPWGGGVVHWITEEVLGIKPLLPGFRKFEVMPHPGSELTEVKGAVPVPDGTIVVSYDTDRGLYEIQVPEGLKSNVGIPKLNRNIREIKLDGRLVYSEELVHRGLPEHIKTENDFICFTGLQGGKHVFNVIYEGASPVYEESAWFYPAGDVIEDTLTSGNWGGTYGSDGYILCAYHTVDDTVQDLRLMPDYVKDITYNKQFSRQWSEGTEDPRAPASGPGNETLRNVGAIYTQDPRATFQTMTVDIDMEESEQHQITLYFVDWDQAGRRVAVEMFDLESKRLLAPVQVIEDYSKGKYLIFKYNAPVRFRINHIRGPNATLSGIFFD
jgi:hypothetical protein